VKEWLFVGINRKPFHKDEWYKLGDLFEKFEAVESLSRLGFLDEAVFYDLISYYITMAVAAIEPTADEFIEDERKYHKGKIPYEGNLYDGFYSLKDKVLNLEAEKIKYKR